MDKMKIEFLYTPFMAVVFSVTGVLEYSLAAEEAKIPKHLEWNVIRDEPVEQAVPGKLPKGVPLLWKAKILPEKLTEAIAFTLEKARRDATERLSARFKKQEISPGVTIGDYIAKSDNPGVGVETFLHGTNERGVRLRGDMLVCEIEKTTRLQITVALFKGWADEHIKLNKAELKRLRDYIEKERFSTIQEIGMAPVPADFVVDEYRKQQRAVENITAVDPGRPLWISESIGTEGGAAIDLARPDRQAARKAAHESALAEARKRLASRIMTLEISEGKTLKKFAETLPDNTAPFLTHYHESPFVTIEDRIWESSVIVLLECRLKPIWNLVLQQRLKEYEPEE